MPNTMHPHPDNLVLGRIVLEPKYLLPMQLHFKLGLIEPEIAYPLSYNSKNYIVVERRSLNGFILYIIGEKSPPLGAFEQIVFNSPILNGFSQSYKNPLQIFSSEGLINLTRKYYPLLSQ
ncbi:hypothetical protein HOG47_07155 [archaeon]|jgi:hypothetical protein|nr:hypothetical protein [archaeon]MBT4022707.1 hypothetical protein [archaeon]